MGSDGTRGAIKLTAADGTVIAQDEETSVVWACRARSRPPGYARRAALDLIAPKVVRLFGGGHA